MKPVLTALIITSFLLSSAPAQKEFTPDSIISIMKKVADYRRGWNDIANMYNPENPWSKQDMGVDWDVGAYMTGIMALYDISGDQTCLDFVREWAIYFDWSFWDNNLYSTFADHQCASQTYLEIYMLDPVPDNEYMIGPTVTNLENLFYNDNTPPADLWWWCDALYMAPPAIARYCEAVNDYDFLDSLSRYWWETSNNLYDPDYHLWYRDDNQKPRTTSNGNPVFWAPGVAWVAAGLARVLEYIPSGHPTRNAYEEQFVEMCGAIKASQGSDEFPGMWTTSMLDRDEWPDAEASSTAFFCFAFAWGVNNGILDSSEYIECIKSAWTNLISNVAEDGRLLRCQHVSWQPDNIDTEHTSPEGEGAFLLAAREIIKLDLEGTSAAGPLKRTKPRENFSINTRRSRLVIAGINDGNTNLRLYDMSGKKLVDIFRQAINGKLSLDLKKESIRPGVYIVELLNKNVKVRSKIDFIYR